MEQLNTNTQETPPEAGASTDGLQQGCSATFALAFSADSTSVPDVDCWVAAATETCGAAVVGVSAVDNFQQVGGNRWFTHIVAQAADEQGAQAILQAVKELYAAKCG